MILWALGTVLLIIGLTLALIGLAVHIFIHRKDEHDDDE